MRNFFLVVLFVICNCAFAESHPAETEAPGTSLTRNATVNENGNSTNLSHQVANDASTSTLESLPPSTVSPNASKRVALVVGNSNYLHSPLKNPRNDALAMGDLLQRAGFEVRTYFDTNLQELQDAVDNFGRSIRNPDVKFALFYYAGHGGQQNWRNYIIPVSANIRTVADIPKQTVDLSNILRYMSHATGRSHLVILDACRDNPFGESYKPEPGLSRFDAPGGSLLAYATAPGNFALDGEGENGLYTGFLLKEFAIPGQRIEDAFKRVRLNVRLATSGQQIPWESTSLEDDVFVFPVSKRALSESEKDKLLDKEIIAWLKAKNSSDPKILANFIREFPSGNASELAQFRLNRLLAVSEAVERKRQRQAEQVAARLAAQKLALKEEDARIQSRKAKERQEIADRVLAASVQAQKQAALQEAATAELEHLQTQRLEQVAGQQTLFALQAQGEQEKIIGTTNQPSVLVLEEKKPAEEAVPEAEIIRTAVSYSPFSNGFSEFQRKYSVGDTASYNVIDVFTKMVKPLSMKVSEVDQEGERVVYNGGEFVSDLMGNITTNKIGTSSTPRQFYPAELFQNKRWQTRFKQSRPNGISYTYEYSLKVVAKEKITVPAGTFEAFRIEARGYNVDLGASLERSIWVAPGVNCDIAHEIRVRLRNGQWEQNDRQELVSYIQAKR